MFGYLVAKKPELKIREYEKYRASYCGLCQALKETCGPLGQTTLSYDMTFLAMTLTALYDSQTTAKTARCVAHGGRKMPYLENTWYWYAADMNLLLTYYKCIDDWHDERKKKSRGIQLLLKKQKRRLKEQYPEKVSAVSRCIRRIWELEAAEGPVDDLRLDDLAVASGQLLAAVFAPLSDVWEPELSLLGFSLGKFIYLMDAYDDLEKDVAAGVFNPLKDLAQQDGYEDRMKRLLMYAAADATAAFERLPILEDAEILRNILYAGIWTRYEKKQRDRQSAPEGNSDHV